MTTLTDRYVWAVVRLLPDKQRPEIDLELHELIAEMTDARHQASAGLDPDEVERAVLTELGDPSRIATRYMERPRSLVGHEVFPEYLRILRLVLLIAVPTVTTLAAVGAAFATEPTVVGVLAAALGAAFSTAIQVAFWVTIVYAFADRWKSPWNTADLPDLPSASTNKGFSVGDAVFGIAVTVLTGVALVWQHARPPMRDDGEGVPVLDPGIWEGPGQALLAIFAASIVVVGIALGQRRWTYPLAAANLALNIASFAVIAWLAMDERLFNTRFLEIVAERADWDQTPTINPWIPVVVVGAIGAWDGVETFVSAGRSRNRSIDPVQVPL